MYESIYADADELVRIFVARCKKLDSECEGELQPDSVAVVPMGCSAHYLSFLLCSLPGQLYLFGQKLNVLAQTTINKKILPETK